MKWRKRAVVILCASIVLIAMVPQVSAGIHTIVKGPKGPGWSSVTWEFIPTSYGYWYGHIENSGLKSVVVEVFDTTAGVPEEVLNQKIRFDSVGAFPNGETDTAGAIMAAGRCYWITVTPAGPKGAYCVVEDMFTGHNEPPVAQFSMEISGTAVIFDGRASYDVDGTVVSYDWDFGDGTFGSGPVVNHSYPLGVLFFVILTVTDNGGLTSSTTGIVGIHNDPPTADFAYKAGRFGFV